MRRRGAALPTVLALVSVVLVMGLAMGSLSTLSLQFNRKHLDGTRAEMAARSGMAHFLSTVYQSAVGADLNPLEPDPSGVSEVFPATGLVIQEGAYRVSIHFDQNRAGYSTDNLSGDSPRVGWADSDNIPRIPEFGLDLVLNVEGPSGVQRYRAVMQRTWPYAVYAKGGPITLMGQPEHEPSLAFPMPTHVDGDVYTSWKGNRIQGTPVAGYGHLGLTDPSKLLANLEARAGYHPQQPPYHPLIIGMPVGYNPPSTHTTVNDDDENELFYLYDESQLVHNLDGFEGSVTFHPGQPFFDDIHNLLEGDLFYDHDLGFEIVPVQVGSAEVNRMEGDIHMRRGLAADPLVGIGPDSNGFSSTGFTPLNLLTPSDEAVNIFGLDPAQVFIDDDNGSEPYLMTETLRLTENENSLGGSISSHYVIDRSVSNRQVLYSDGGAGPKGLYVREVLAGLELEGVVLHVKGDLDLGASVLDKEIPISGSGATLVVDGQLIVGNAQINAGDQGFVIYAKDIVLKGGGSFYGLMIAENSVTILSQGDKALEIQGGLLCAGEGGITLRGAQVKHDPQYLKAINGGGDFYLASWSELNR